MTKYGIHLGKIDTDPRESLEAIKAAGFDAVLLHLGGKYPDRDLADAIAGAGLVIDNVHAPWDGINHIWRAGERGEAVTERLLGHMETCASLGVKRVVYHVSAGNNYPPISEIGIDRMKRMVETAEHLGVDMCLENQRFFHFIDYIYYRIDSPRLRFCYDSGHEACFSQTKLALPKYRDRLSALHLHDNDGEYEHDEHLLPGYSTGVDWDYVRRNIADYDGVISLEVRYINGMSCDEFYAAAMKAARFVKQ